MNVKYINPFLSAARDIISQCLYKEPTFEKPFVKTVPFDSRDLLIIIGITGEMKGKVMINISKSSCVNIASTMMGGMKMEFDELSKSAAGELCNMIVGTTAMIFEKENIRINITSPTIIEGAQLKVSLKEQIICIPVIVDEGIRMEINISNEGDKI